MGLKTLLAYGSLAVCAVWACTTALAGSKDLADSVKALIEANEPEDWPDRCETLRAEMLNTV